MFKLTFKYRLEKLQLAKDLYPKARKKFAERIASVAIPKIKRDVESLIAPYPGPSVNGPNAGIAWEFATPKSREWFWANFPYGYERTGQLEKGWQVNLVTTFDYNNAAYLAVLTRDIPLKGDITVSISNGTVDTLGRSPNLPYSMFVYGPRQVKGHFRTGWGYAFWENSPIVRQNAMGYISAEWGPSVKAALVEE